MLKNLLDLLPYSIGILVAIILPATFVALQEVYIEGPFGWSALTFTKRFPTKSLISKIFRSVVGQDKWATTYHLVSMAIWGCIFAVPVVFVLIYAKMAGVVSSGAVAGISALAFASLVLFSVTEDYIWFLVHPYYGPERHKPEYVYWFQNFKGGIPVTYWGGMILTVIITGVAAYSLKRWEVLEIWVMSLALVTIFSFGFLRAWAKKVPRLSLVKHWWEKVGVVVIERCQFPTEGAKDPNQEVSAYVISQEVLQRMVESGDAVPLSEALAGKN